MFGKIYIAKERERERGSGEWYRKAKQNNAWRMREVKNVGDYDKKSKVACGQLFGRVSWRGCIVVEFQSLLDASSQALILPLPLSYVIINVHFSFLYVFLSYSTIRILPHYVFSANSSILSQFFHLLFQCSISTIFLKFTISIEFCILSVHYTWYTVYGYGSRVWPYSRTNLTISRIALTTRVVSVW